MDWHSNITSSLEDASVGMFHNSMRFLGGGDEYITIDYTIFAMVFVTMVCLYIVGVIRHSIDHVAQSHDYFQQVLEACYHECKARG